MPSLPPPCALPPLRLGVESDQSLGAHIILLPHELGNIDIQGTVRLGARQQLMYARHGGRDGVGWGPRRLEQIEADLAGLEVDVGVADGRDEADRGRRKGVGVWDVDVEGPAAAWGLSGGWLIIDVEWTVLRQGEREGERRYLHKQCQARPS
jgi:hypothetical protein